MNDNGDSDLGGRRISESSESSLVEELTSPSSLSYIETFEAELKECQEPKILDLTYEN